MDTAITTNLGVCPFQAIERAGLAKTTSRQYKRAIELYLQSGNSLGNAEQLADYADGLKQSSKAFLKSAVRLWTKEVERIVKAQTTPDNVEVVQATVYRLESVNDAISVKQQSGNKAHVWLSSIEVKRLLNAATSKRDKLVLALLVGAGLRRNELVTLKYSDVETLGDRTVLNVTGKGDKSRVIPISAKIAEMIEESKTATT